jgi:hypothetical protein
MTRPLSLNYAYNIIIGNVKKMLEMLKKSGIRKTGRKSAILKV